MPWLNPRSAERAPTRHTVDGRERTGALGGDGDHPPSRRRAGRGWESRGLLGYEEALERWGGGGGAGGDREREGVVGVIGGRGMGLALLGNAPILVLVDCSSEGLVVAICNAGLEGAGVVVTAGVCGAGWPAPVGTDGGVPVAKTH